MEPLRGWSELGALWPDGIALLSREGEIRFVNDIGARSLGRSVGDLVGRTLHELVTGTPEATDRLLTSWARSRAMTPAVLTLAGSAGDDGRRRVHGGLVDPEGDGGRPLLMLRLQDQPHAADQFSVLNQRIADLTEEITRRRSAEAVLDGQREVLEIIGRSHDLVESLTAIVRLVESWTDGAIGSILLLDEEDRLRLGAAPGLPPAYNEAIEGLAIGPNVGSCGTATYHGRPVIVAEIATDPLWRDYRDLALAHGLAACWSFPVVGGDGCVLGSVAMYYKEPRAPGPRDTEMTRVACRMAAIAIERARAEGSLRARADQLEEAARRKDEFLAMLGHELRNPLAPIMTTVELLARTPEDLPDHVEVLRRQLAHLVRLVDDLLEVSRATKGAITLRREPVEVAELVGQAADDARLQASDRELSLEVRTPDDPVWVDGDPDRLYQVLGNLLQNAVRYTEAGGRIEVDVEVDGDVVQIVVRDTGVGIEPELLPLVFDAFTQGGQRLDRSGGGLGIGLTLVRALVERHGGTVTARSEGRGKGSEFAVRLPRGAPPTSATARTTVSAGRSAATLSVLLVEDNLDSARALAALLEIWGHECTTAHDGPSALARADEASPHVVVLDIGLPEMDGFEVARELRRRPGLGPGECLLIALTGYGQEADRNRALEAGFDAHLTKPVDLDRLEELLATVDAPAV